MAKDRKKTITLESVATIMILQGRHIFGRGRWVRNVKSFTVKYSKLFDKSRASNLELSSEKVISNIILGSPSHLNKKTL